MRKLSGAPIILSPHCWYYEERGGLRMVVEGRDGVTRAHLLTARRLASYLRRREAADRARKG